MWFCWMGYGDYERWFFSCNTYCMYVQLTPSYSNLHLPYQKSSEYPGAMLFYNSLQDKYTACFCHNSFQAYLYPWSVRSCFLRLLHISTICEAKVRRTLLHVTNSSFFFFKKILFNVYLQPVIYEKTPAQIFPCRVLFSAPAPLDQTCTIAPFRPLQLLYSLFDPSLRPFLLLSSAFRQTRPPGSEP